MFEVGRSLKAHQRVVLETFHAVGGRLVELLWGLGVVHVAGDLRGLEELVT